MDAYDSKKHLKTVFFIEVAILISLIVYAYGFWNSICSTSLRECLLKTNYIAPSYFLLLCVIRPFIFTPIIIFHIVAGQTFGPFWGALLGSLGATFSTTAVYILGKYVGKSYVNPWLSTNLPQTLKFLRSQDWKIVLASRLIPIIPFDLSSLIFGLVDFRFKKVLAMSFLGSIPTSIMMAYVSTPNSTAFSSTIVVLSIACAFLLLPGIALEIYSRKKGTSLWIRAKAMWNEIMYEVKVNNDVVKKNNISGEKIPVLLVYGFFSSRKVLTPLEKRLTAKGYEVLSFNLGGLLGVFFTRGIIDTAEFIDYKLKRQFNRHNFSEVQIVAHSKGGLVALWWLLKLGGDKYCKKVITMGTPFQGTLLTWLALVTPLGFIWPDMWQMRPNSAFLNSLRNSAIPKDVKIFCFFSKKDKVAQGKKGIFKALQDSSQIQSIEVNMGHFEYLNKKSVVDLIDQLLDSDPPQRLLSETSTSKTEEVSVLKKAK